jgi:glycosyltransferase 2 family protein
VQFEPALACGTMLLIVTFMSVIPVGLIWARVEHVSLKKISEQSEQFSEEHAEPTPVISEA